MHRRDTKFMPGNMKGRDRLWHLSVARGMQLGWALRNWIHLALDRDGFVNTTVNVWILC